MLAELNDPVSSSVLVSSDDTPNASSKNLLSALTREINSEEEARLKSEQAAQEMAFTDKAGGSELEQSLEDKSNQIEEES